MFFPKVAISILAAGILAMSGAAFAQDSKLVVVMGGEAYDGPPKFSVSMGGKSIGEGAVAKAIDTGTDKRFADADDKASYVESFSFDVPKADFSPNGDIRIRLTNEAYGGEGSNRDRNLFVSSITLNGTEIKAGALVTNSTAGIKPNTMVGDYLLLADGSEEAVALAPTGGWPDAGGAAASTEKAVEAPPAAKAAEAVPAPTVTKPPQNEAPALVATTNPSNVPLLESATPKPATEAVAPKPATEPEKTAARTDTKNVGTCAFEEAFHILGFNENSNDLTPRVTGELDKIAAAIGKQKCSILLTGYSSAQGSYSVNALFAVERAQNALKYLRDRGVEFKSAQATGAGETTQFGKDFRANRRVVITVTP